MHLLVILRITSACHLNHLQRQQSKHHVDTLVGLRETDHAHLIVIYRSGKSLAKLCTLFIGTCHSDLKGGRCIPLLGFMGVHSLELQVSVKPLYSEQSLYRGVHPRGSQKVFIFTPPLQNIIHSTNRNFLDF